MQATITGGHVSALSRCPRAVAPRYNPQVAHAPAVPEKQQSGSRLDVWLDVACLFKTRSEAARAIEGGKVEVNGQRVKAHRVLRENDEVVVQRGNGRKQTVVVRGFSE